MTLIAALQLVRISRFVYLPQKACSVTCKDTLCERNFCHLQHADAWIVVVILLAMLLLMMMIIMILVTVTIIII